MINANLQEQKISFNLSGPYNDFNSDWFRFTGNVILGAMIFNAFYPIMEFLGFYFLRLIKRLIDTGCTLNKSKTRTKSVRAYVEIHAGPIFYIHFKYAAVLNIVFVTMLFGFGIPILFPLAAFSLAIMYFLETALLYYSYRAPPAYEKEISVKVLKLLIWAPLFYLAFGYWMASSMQLYDNEHLTKIDRASDIMESKHLVQDVFTKKAWLSPRWATIGGFFFVFVTILLLRTFLPYMGWLQYGELEIVEELKSFWNATGADQRIWTIKEEENCRRALGMKKMQNECLHSLEKVHLEEDWWTFTRDKTMKGIHSYDILANPHHNYEMQYVIAARENREDYIIDDDEDDANNHA